MKYKFRMKWSSQDRSKDWGEDDRSKDQILITGEDI